jgi:hypothetical protein
MTEPSPAPATSPAPEPASTQASTQARSRKPLAAKIAGIVGIVICLLIIVAVWFGLGTVSQAVNDLGTSVNSGFDRAITATDRVAAGLDNAAATIDQMRADAVELASTASPDTPRLDALQARLGQFADAYRDLRVRYAEARENVVTLTTSVQRVAAFIPGVRVPEGAGDRLKAVDDKLQAIDAAIVSTWTTVADAQPGKAVADALAGRATPVKDALTSASTAITDLSTNLQGVQARADSTVDAIRTILLIAAVALTILFVWVLALNIALWLLGRTWERENRAAG